MGIMLYFSLYFYKSHFKEEFYEDFDSISETIIAKKLYTYTKSNKIKEKLLENSRWCLPSYKHVLENITITIDSNAKHFLNDHTIYSNTQMDNGKWINISMSDAHMQKEYKELFSILSAVIIIILILTSLIILWRIRTLVKPLKCLTQLCHDVQLQTNQIQLCQPNTYEVKELYDAILSLLQKNHILYEGKVDLFKEAAHELKAPLAVMQARLNLLQEKDHYTKETYIDETSADIQLLNSKLKELLFLKEIESDLQQESSQEVCMMEQCKNMQARFKPIMDLKKITIDTNVEESFKIKTHAKALMKVMQVIFENVFLHSPTNSVIKVEVFPEEKRMRITNQVDPSGSQHISSHIGLKIIDRLSENLDYDFETSSTEETFITTIIFH